MERDLYADSGERERLINEYRRRDRVEGLEVDWMRRDRKRIRVRLSGRPVHDDVGRLEGFEMIVEDVTERRTLETQLRQAQKMEAVGELTGGIAHDLNNVLTIISANLDMITASVQPEGVDLRADLLQVQEAARKGRALIRKLLGFSRRSTLEIRPVDVGHLVTELLDMLRRVVPASIDVHLTITDNLVIEADPGAIEQILVNLVTNARDAMPDGGSIDIAVGRAHLTDDYRASRPWATLGECVRLRVADSGMGMDGQTLERIFEPFFTTKPYGVGTGLGMAMVYGLVKQQGGFIDVASELGRGTKIDLCFPLSDKQAPVVVCDEVMHDVRGGSETILVVEDEEPIRRVTRRVLEKHGYTVLTAMDGQDALRQYSQYDNQIDLVISDVVMPKMGGTRLYEQLSAAGRPPKILFTSGYTAKDFRVSGALDPSLPFLHKPWSVTEMLQKVREVLDS
jgi:signal transduction histidine kinase